MWSSSFDFDNIDLGSLKFDRMYDTFHVVFFRFVIQSQDFGFTG